MMAMTGMSGQSGLIATTSSPTPPPTNYGFFGQFFGNFFGNFFGGNR